MIPEFTGGGSEMRAASQIMALSELFDITLAIMGDHGREVEVHEFLEDDVKTACVAVVVISRISLINRRLRNTQSFWARVLLEALWPIPPAFAAWRLPVAELGRRLADERFDVVHCFRLYTALPRLLGRHRVMFERAVLDFDDYQSQAEFRSVTAFRNLIGNRLSVVNWFKAVKWWFLEALLVPSFDDALVCSELDQQRLRRRFPSTQWHVVPNTVVEPPPFCPIRSGRFTFLFVGILTYLPNWDAVLFFCTRVVPILRRVGPGELRVLIVGRVGCDLDLNKLTAIEEVRVVANPLDLSPTTRSPTRLSSRSGAAVEPASKFSKHSAMVCPLSPRQSAPKDWTSRPTRTSSSQMAQKLSPSSAIGFGEMIPFVGGLPEGDTTCGAENIIRQPLRWR